MQLPLTVALTALSAAVLAPTATSAALRGPQEWFQLAAPLRDGATMNPSLSEGARGLVVCAFQDNTVTSGRGSTMVFNARARAWADVGAPGSGSVGRDWWPRVGFGPGGSVFRVNYDYGSGSRLGVRELGATTPGHGYEWRAVASQSFSTGEAHCTDLVVDGQDRAIIGFRDGPGGNDLDAPQGAMTVLRVNSDTRVSSALGGPGFSDAFMPPGQPSSAWHTNLERAPDGTLFAAWAEKSFPDFDHRTYVAKYDEDAGEWELLGPPGLGHDAPGLHLNLQLDPDGAPVVALRGYSPPCLRVYRFNEADQGWDQVGGDIGALELSTQLGDRGFSTNGGYREQVPLAIDRAGNMYVGCRAADPESDDDLRVKMWRFDGTSWSTAGATGFLPGTGPEDYPALLCAGGRIPVLVCRRHPDAPGEELISHVFL